MRYEVAERKCPESSSGLLQGVAPQWTIFATCFLTTAIEMLALRLKKKR